MHHLVPAPPDLVHTPPLPVLPCPSSAKTDACRRAGSSVLIGYSEHDCKPMHTFLCQTFKYLLLFFFVWFFKIWKQLQIKRMAVILSNLLL